MDPPAIYTFLLASPKWTGRNSEPWKKCARQQVFQLGSQVCSVELCGFNQGANWKAKKTPLSQRRGFRVHVFEGVTSSEVSNKTLFNIEDCESGPRYPRVGRHVAWACEFGHRIRSLVGHRGQPKGLDRDRMKSTYPYIPRFNRTMMNDIVEVLSRNCNKQTSE